MSLHRDYKHYIEEIESEIRTLESTEDLSDEQRRSMEEVKHQLKEAHSSNSLIQIWSHINLARALRALYVPDSRLAALVAAEQKRDKDFLDQKTRDAWQPELDIIVEKLSNSPESNQTSQSRQLLFRYLQQAGRKWNSINAREDLKMTSWIRLSFLTFLAITLALVVLRSTDAYVSALFGGIGGLISSNTAVLEFPVQFRTKRLSVLTLFVRPLTGSIVALILFQFLVSGISPIEIAPLASPTTKTAWIAAVSFGGGFSERFVLGKLGFSE